MSANKAPNGQSEFLKSFGRRKGRLLTVYKQQLVDDLLPTLTPPAKLSTNKQIWLEIGFGGGEHLYELASNYPDRYFIGAEPYINGVAMLLVQMDERPLDNLSVIADDVRPWLKTLPKDSLDGAYILFPDPWPKSNHHKRRIINNALLDLLAHTIKPKGILRIATDHVDYSAWIMEHLLAHPAYDWPAKSHKDWSEPFKDWKQTRYQQKTTKQGRLPIFLEFIRQ